MKYTLHIKRQKDSHSRPYWQDFSYEGSALTVSQMLLELNERDPLSDCRGIVTSPVRWQHSCFVRKCGACAMRINGKPRLACASFLKEYKHSIITIEPLQKFPVVSDLIVDRSCISERLKAWQIWLEEEARPMGWTFENRYQSSRCLLCGCCLEVCPNYQRGGLFAGAAAAVNAYRILTAERQKTAHYEALSRIYKQEYYEGCGQSLACEDICPARIPVTELLACANHQVR